MRLRPDVMALLVGVVSSSPAQTPPETRMHRIQAGQLEADGWTKARSSEGGFAVKLPVRFNDYTVQELNPTTEVTKLYTVTGKNAAGVKFSATRWTFRKATTAGERFKKMQEGSWFPDPPTSLERGEYQGVPTVDATFVQKRAFNLDPVVIAFQRTLLAGPDQIILLIEAPVAQREAAKQALPTFLASLEPAGKRGS